MKLAIVHPDFVTKGGAENLIYWICRELSRRGDTAVTIFTTDFGDSKNKLGSIEGIKLERIEIPRFATKNRVLTMIFAARWLRSRLRCFDVINPHNFPASLWVGLALIAGVKKPRNVVWNCNEPPRFLYRHVCNRHTPFALQLETRELNAQLKVKLSSRIKFGLKEIYKPLLRVLDRTLVRRFSKLVTISDTVAGQIREIYGICTVEICMPGIIPRADVSYRSEKGDYLLTVSRLEPLKNIANIIETIKFLRDTKGRTDIRYYIVGKGPLQSHLKELIRDYSLDANVKLLGYVDDHALLEYYRRCLAYIYIPYDEPFGLPYLEAALFSKISIASGHGGPSEIVRNGKTGLLVDPADIGSIARAITWLYENKDNVAEMEAAAQEIATTEFRWDAFIKKYVDVLNIKDMAQKNSSLEINQCI